MTRSLFPLVIGLLAATAGGAPFDAVRVDAKGVIEHVWWRDLNGDGRPDLVLLVREEPDGDVPHRGGAGAQRLAIHYADRSGRVPATASQRLAPFGSAPLSGAALIAVADLTPDPGVELVFVTADAVHALVHRDGRLAEPRRVADARLAWPAADEGVRAWSTHAPAAGGERELILLPTAGGFDALRVGDDGSPRIEPIDLPPERRMAVGSHEHFALVTEHPTPRLADYDGDGRIDILAVSGGALVGHLQSRRGSLSAKPTFRAPMSILDPNVNASAGNQLLRHIIDVVDIDGDRRIDLIVTRTRGKLDLFGSFESQIFHFRGPRFWSKESGDLVSPPSGVVKVTGVATAPVLFDLDGDGRRDLIVTTLTADAVGRTLLKRVNAGHRCYRYDAAKQTFETSPFFALERPYPLAWLERNDTSATHFFTGDFDGDGRRDLLDIAAGGSDRLEILRGARSTGMFSSGGYGFDDTLLSIRASLVSDVRILDANGDGADDLLVHDGRTVVILYSKRG